MRDAIFPMPEEELAAIERAASAFRERWASVKNAPWPAAFDFTLNDVHTIDYMEYEGLKFPDCGMDGAVLIVAEVVRRAAQIRWYMSYRGEWILADKNSFGGFAVAPRARFHEYECGRGTQFDNYLNLMAELAIECVWAEHGEGLVSLFPQGSEYFDRVQKKLDRIRRPGGSK
jgi:hypothetical protein